MKARTQKTVSVSTETAHSRTLFLAQAAMIAALYIVLTFIANAFGLANHAVQVRFSEALTVLPYFTPAAIPGLYIGCFLSNILTGCALPDILFGSLATLLGALGTYA
ncbi:MAG: QueT transporter family protein, partial [Eubacterium sp.]|nr:QueT transporter family protein [Eubacterium sp.]